MYKELVDINEIALALKVKELVCDVDHELKTAERELLDIKATDYDMSYIVSEQSYMHDKYKKKMKKIGVSLC